MKVRVVRVIVYETQTQEEMDKQLGNSMPDGRKDISRYGPDLKGQTISVYTLRGNRLRRLWDLLKRLV